MKEVQEAGMAAGEWKTSRSEIERARASERERERASERESVRGRVSKSEI